MLVHVSMNVQPLRGPQCLLTAHSEHFGRSAVLQRPLPLPEVSAGQVDVYGTGPRKVDHLCCLCRAFWSPCSPYVFYKESCVTGAKPPARSLACFVFVYSWGAGCTRGCVCLILDVLR